MNARTLLTTLAASTSLLAAERWAAAEPAEGPADPAADTPETRPSDEPAEPMFDPPQVRLPHDGPSRTRGVHLGVEAMTDFPVAIGGQVTLEVPYGFRITASAGALIRPYIDVINDTVVSVGGYDQRTADVISASLGNSLVWNIHLAWRPFRRAGFYVAGGYRQVTLGGAVNPVEVVEIATGQTLPQEARAILESSYQVTSTLHMIDAELGWELVIARHLTLRLALGAALTVRAHTELPQVNVDVPAQYEQYISQDAADGIISEARQIAGDYLDSVYESYVFTPTFSVGLGYRFF